MNYESVLCAVFCPAGKEVVARAANRARAPKESIVSLLASSIYLQSM